MKKLQHRFISTVAALSLALGIFIPTVSADTQLPSEAVDVIITLSEDTDPKVVAELIVQALPGTRVLAYYDTLLHGFALNVKHSAISLIVSLDAVESIRVSGSFEPLEAEVEPSVTPENAAANLIGIYNEASVGGLDGDGIVVAVLDTGFDVTHPAFVGDGITEVLGQADIEGLLESESLSLSTLPFDASELYVSSKIPFAFDYIDGDTDVSSTSTHGAHVAGIIGAAETYEGSMRGIAPGVQLVLMKIFDDNGQGSSDHALLSALEDAVKLGADVINLSLGSYSGSTAYDDKSGINTVISRAEKLGCIVVCAGGNESVTTERSTLALDGITELARADYTDYGTINHPAAFSATLSVASANGYFEYYRSFKLGEELIKYSDTNDEYGLTDGGFAASVGDRPLAYVPIPGVGSASDYKGLNVRGKLALVKRGEITFAEKAANAAAKGAVGVIVYNDVPDGELNMDLTDSPLPAISISLADGEGLLAAQDRTVVFSSDLWYAPTSLTPGAVSAFSSVGCTPSLTLKPDLTAVGANVYSTLYDGEYGEGSGTSMAAPQLAGVCALLLEKLNRELSPEDDLMGYISRRVGTLRRALMNTASLILQEDGIEYSPRSQGAGLVNPSAAISRELEITYSANGEAKAELFDLLGEHVYLDVTLENLTDSSLEVSLGVTLTGDGYTELELDGKREYYSTLTAVPDTASVIRSGEVDTLNRYSDGYAPLLLTLQPGEARVVPLELELDERYSEELDRIFTNGRFIEGFVIADTESGEYSLPYMGYHGDWSEGSIFDADVYSDEAPIFAGSSLMIMLGDALAYAGDDTVRTVAQLAEAGEGIPSLDAERLVFSPNGDGIADSLYLNVVLLRNARHGMLRVLDAEGSIVCTVEDMGNYFAKARSADEGYHLTLAWTGSDGENLRYILPDGRYRLEYVFTLDFMSDITQTLAFDVTLDTEKPELVSTRLENGRLYITAADENPMLYIRLYDGDAGNFDRVAKCAISEDRSCEVWFELDGAPELLYVELLDQAYNSTVEPILIGGMN